MISRDSTHPFKSGAVALKIFFKNNLIIQETDNEDKSEINQKIERIYFLLINSAKLDSYSNSGGKIINIYASLFKLSA